MRCRDLQTPGITQKLRRLYNDIKNWNSEVFGRIEVKKQLLFLKKYIKWTELEKKHGQ